MKNIKKNILFLCTGNSCRSQMAEAWTRNLKNDLFEAYSAGINPGTVDVMAIKVMSEKGVDISGYKAKHPDIFKNIKFDYVVTVCDRANEKCPLFPGKTQKIHMSFDDPPSLSNYIDEKKSMEIYRRVRDEIRSFVEEMPENLMDNGQLRIENE